MTRKDQPTRSDPGGWFDLIVDILTDLEGLCGVFRFVGHAVFLCIRAVFHLLTCHF